MTKRGRGRPQRTEPDNRAASMAALYRNGNTLHEIGLQFGVTRERIRQILTHDFGFNFASGGMHVRAERRLAEKLAKLDARSIARWGCTFSQYRAIRDLKKPTRAYHCQRMNANSRGIEWQFNLWTWWQVWVASGKWEMRGRGHGFMMCRKGDKGPYAPWNVTIARGIENSYEGSPKNSRKLPVGVRKRGDKFLARGRFAGEYITVGEFDTPEAAHTAYIAASDEHARAA